MIRMIILLSLLVVAMFFCFVGCQSTDASANQPTVQKLSPVIIGLVVDHSGSYINHPPVDSAGLYRLLSAVGDRGGYFAVGIITESSFTPLLSAELRLDTMPLVGNLLSKAKIHQANILKQKEFRVVQDKFFKQIWAKISQKPSAPKTDIAGAMKRMEILFSQPTFDGWDRIQLIGSDGIENCRKGSFKWVAETDIYTVGWPQDLAEQLLNRPVVEFENFNSLINHLISTRLKQDKKVVNTIAVQGN